MGHCCAGCYNSAITHPMSKQCQQEDLCHSTGTASCSTVRASMFYSAGGWWEGVSGWGGGEDGRTGLCFIPSKVPTSIRWGYLAVWLQTAGADLSYPIELAVLFLGARKQISPYMRRPLPAVIQCCIQHWSGGSTALALDRIGLVGHSCFTHQKHKLKHNV